MKFVKNYFSDRKIGFYLAFGSALLAIVSAILYLIVYFAIKGQEMDRVFSVTNVVFIFVGGLVALVLENFRFKFGRIVPVIFYSVGFAGHIVETAYPLADIYAGVDFFGGNLTVALIFVALFGISTIAAVVASFKD